MRPRLRLRPEPFVVVAAGCLLGAAVVYVVLSNPVEAALWAAIGSVLGGAFAGVAVGLSGPDLPEFDYTAVGSVLLVIAFLAAALLAGRPVGGYLTAALGGVGAACVGLDSGLERAPGRDDTDETPS